MFSYVIVDPNWIGIFTNIHPHFLLHPHPLSDPLPCFPGRCYYIFIFWLNLHFYQPLSLYRPPFLSPSNLPLLKPQRLCIHHWFSFYTICGYIWSTQKDRKSPITRKRRSIATTTKAAINSNIIVCFSFLFPSSFIYLHSINQT